MKNITSRYPGTCKKCGNNISVGAECAHERFVGIFCLEHAPTDIEEIRSYKQESANRRAEKYEAWAEKRESSAQSVLDYDRRLTGDLAFCTQPGRIPLRDKIHGRDDRACESIKIAEQYREKADDLRKVRVAGDAERDRQFRRDENDLIIKKGSTVFDAIFGQGEVVSVCKKSYRIKFLSGGTYARDKSYVATSIFKNRGDYLRLANGGRKNETE